MAESAPHERSDSPAAPLPRVAADSRAGFGATASGDAIRLGAMTLAAMIGFGLLAVLLGQSDNWDLRNYHLYDGWAFWTGRASRDFAAAQAQTYFNPLLATASYLLLVNTPPWLGTFVLGAVQGANILPLYVLARALLPQHGPVRPLWVTLAGMLGSTQLAELGTSFGDTLVSLPLLGAYAIALAAPTQARGRLAIAGLLIGAAVGIKLTVAPFAAGLAAAVALLHSGGPARWRDLGIFAGSALLAFAATDGFWIVHVYREFGNPLFPAFSAAFGGTYAPPLALRDTRYLPHAAIEWLLYPLVWLFSPRRVSNAWFLDLRIPLAFLALPFLLCKPRSAGAARARPLAVAFALGYVLWLALFGLYRYLVPLEMLAPLVIVLAISPSSRAGMMLCATLLALLIVLVHPPRWQRLHGYGAQFLEVDLPTLPRLDRATVILAEDQPLAFLALRFPASTRFVRIAGNLLGPPYPPYEMDRAAARRIAAAQGPLYALLADPAAPGTQSALDRQQLILRAPCAPVYSNLLPHGQPVELCPLQLSASLPERR